MAEHRDKPAHAKSEEADGCDLDFQDHPTRDVDLPPAWGGVQHAVKPAHPADSDHTDGCDLDFDDGITTKDDELPTATGGVA